MKVTNNFLTFMRDPTTSRGKDLIQPIKTVDAACECFIMKIYMAQIPGFIYQNMLQTNTKCLTFIVSVEVICRHRIHFSTFPHLLSAVFLSLERK